MDRRRQILELDSINMPDIASQARHAKPQPHHRNRLRDRIQVPAPVKKFFATFPLQTYPAIQPRTTKSTTTIPTLYAYGPGWLDGWASFDIECLKWQAFLRFATVDFDVKYCNEPTASPSGQLPFLLIPSTDSSAKVGPKCLAGPDISKYAQEHGDDASLLENSDIADSKAFIALAETQLHSAVIFHLWADQENFQRIVEKYGAIHIHNEYLRRVVMEERRRAVLEKTFVRNGTLNREQVYAGAKEALAALKSQLESSDTDYFFSSSKPTVLDAIVFAYVQTIITFPCAKGHSELKDYVHSHHGELVSHSRRIYTLMTSGRDRVIGKVGIKQPDYSQSSMPSAQEIVDGAKDAAQNVVDATKRAAQSASDAAQPAFDKAQETASQAFDTAKEVAGKVADAAKDAAHKASDAAYNAAQSASDAAQPTIDKAKNAAKDAADKVQDTVDQATAQPYTVEGDVEAEMSEAMHAQEAADKAASTHGHKKKKHHK